MNQYQSQIIVNILEALDDIDNNPHGTFENGNARGFLSGLYQMAEFCGQKSAHAELMVLVEKLREREEKKRERETKIRIPEFRVMEES